MRVVNNINFVPKNFLSPFSFKKLTPLIIEVALQALKRLLRRLDEILESKITSLLQVFIFFEFNFCISTETFFQFFKIS